MLRTNLQHTDTNADFTDVVENNENVMICCGRMGPMCLPVYDIMDSIKDNYENVIFRDMDFDGPAGHNIASLPECRRFNGLPFTVYFKNGKVVAATTSIQNKKQIKEILDREFA
ncbi:MAG: thioredoxin family protein [Candidatus Sabulitectum sp.]|nr:thioredoxin family protein [Candidatus Sabulitectum sp.]